MEYGIPIRKEIIVHALDMYHLQPGQFNGIIEYTHHSPVAENPLQGRNPGANADPHCWEYASVPGGMKTV